MCPVLFKIFGFEVRSFGIMLVIGFVVGLMIAKRRAPRYGLDPSRIYDLGILLVLLGVIGARLAYIVQEWPQFAADPKSLYSLKFDGLTSFGGLIFGLLGMLIWSKRTKTSMLAALDVFAVPVLVAHAIGRIGCLLNGCCYGGLTDLPWGVHFEGITSRHHPAQIYDSLMCLGGAALLILAERRGLARGQSMSLMFFFYGLSRFIYEFWRAGSSSTYWGSLPITQAQAMAGLLVILGAVMFAVFGKRRIPALETSPG